MKKLKSELKIADRFLEAKLDVMVLSHLDEEIRLREVPLDKKRKGVQ